VVENNGRVAVQRGPLVYCMEQIDQGRRRGAEGRGAQVQQRSGGGFEETFEKDLAGWSFGAPTSRAVYEESADRSSLYFRTTRRHGNRVGAVTFILTMPGQIGPNPDASLDPSARA